MLPGFGVSPSPHILLPPIRLRRTPQEEWGARGLNSSIQVLLAGSSSLPAPALNSRFPVSLRTSSAGMIRLRRTGGLGGGILGACNAPLQRFAVMVQRSAAGGLGVPPKKCRRTSCRESEGVPQLISSPP